MRRGNSEVLTSSSRQRGGRLALFNRSASTNNANRQPTHIMRVPRGTNNTRQTTNHDRSNNNNNNANTFRVLVPEGVFEGDDFHVVVRDEVVRVRCPPNAFPGQSIAIQMPKLPRHKEPLPPDTPGITRVRNPSNEAQDAYLVEIPPGVRPGKKFPVTIRGQSLSVTCPRQARPGMRVRVAPPPPEQEEDPTESSADSALLDPLHQEFDTQLFEVQVPYYVRPGRPFALVAGGIRVLVNCPYNAYPSQMIRFRLPKALFGTMQTASSTATQRLLYDKDGWSRTVRITDQRFQWIRMDQDGAVDDRHLKPGRFDPEKSAFCRTLKFVDGFDSRVRDGILELVPAHQASCDTKVRNDKGEAVVTYPDLAEAQGLSFEQKAQWFKQKCKQLEVDWESGHMRINIRRKYLLEDSIDAIMSLSRRDLNKLWRFEFIGEKGIDAGGLAREWFYLVTSEIFDPDFGFWLPSEGNQMCMNINPASRMLHNDYLLYYRFLGRVMGKAMFDGQLVASHMAQYIYKHILGWPITFSDLKSYDEGYYMSLKQIIELAKSGDDVEMILCMDFTTTEDMMGKKQDIDLIPNGADYAVTNDNYQEYLEACLKYRMLERVKPQLNELLLGFFDVIPEALLTVFDFQELELLMCGLPKIDLADWMAHTVYAGELENIGGEHPNCQWFWEVVYEFDQEMKARLLQFVTGTSGVPARGFAVLQGNDGSIRKFTINGVSVDVCLYPRAHTCFNRIDLPMYETKAKLRENLVLAVTMAATGFDLE